MQWPHSTDGQESPSKRAFGRLLKSESTTDVRQLSVLVSTTAFSATTDLVKILPVAFAIIDSNFLPSIDASRDQHDPLEAKPREAFILRIWQARVVDEAGEVAFASLKDLVCRTTVHG